MDYKGFFTITKSVILTRYNVVLDAYTCISTASKLFLQILYNNFSKIYLESLKTQKNQNISRGFLLSFVLFVSHLGS